MKITRIENDLYFVGDTPPSPETVEYAQGQGKDCFYMKVIGSDDLAEAVAIVGKHALSIYQLSAAKTVLSDGGGFAWRDPLYGPSLHAALIHSNVREAVLHWLRHGTFDGVLSDEAEQGV